MSGPLPDPKRRRRNAPTIPTTDLPAGGRKGKPPKTPDAYELGHAGRKWWTWAWHLPQACAWDDGALYVIARRAQLEDDLDALKLTDELEIADLLAGASEEAIERVEYALSSLKKLATGKLAIEKEMRELDNKLGLNPKALSDLRWKIVDDEAESEQERPPKSRSASARRGRLSVVK